MLNIVKNNSAYNYTAISRIDIDRGNEQRGSFKNHVALSRKVLPREQQAADVIGARFQAIAKSGNKNLLVKALTGKSLQELSPSQQTAMRNFLAALAEGKIAMPKVILAQNGAVDPGMSASAKGAILPEGVNGAFVKTGGAGTALISRTIFEKDPKAANEILEHEIGHALGHAAQQFGVKVADGEDGERMRLAVDGKDPAIAGDMAGKNLFDPKSEMHGTVKINGVVHKNVEFLPIQRQIYVKITNNIRRALAEAQALNRMQPNTFGPYISALNALYTAVMKWSYANTILETRYTLALGRDFPPAATNAEVLQHMRSLIVVAPNPDRIPGSSELGEASFFRRFDQIGDGSGNKIYVVKPPESLAAREDFEEAVIQAFEPVEDPANRASTDISAAALHPTARKIMSVMEQYFITHGYPQINDRMPRDRIVAELEKVAAALPSTSRNTPTVAGMAGRVIAQGLNDMFAQWGSQTGNFAGRGVGTQHFRGPPGHTQFLVDLANEAPALFGGPGPLNDIKLQAFIKRYLNRPDASFPSTSSPDRLLPLIDIVLNVLRRTQHRDLLAWFLSRFVTSRMSAAAKARQFPPPPPPPGGAAVMAKNWPLSGLPTSRTVNLPVNADFRKTPLADKLGRAANQALMEATGKAGSDIAKYVKNNPGATAVMGVGIGALVAIQFVPGVNVVVDAILGVVGAGLYAAQSRTVTAPNIKAALAGFRDFLKFGISGKTGLALNKAKNGFKVFLQKAGVEGIKLLGVLTDVLAVGRGAMSLVNLAQKAKAFFSGLRASEIVAFTGTKAVNAFRNFGKWFNSTLRESRTWSAKHLWSWHPVKTATNWLQNLWKHEAQFLRDVWGNIRPSTAAAAREKQGLELAKRKVKQILADPDNGSVYGRTPAGLRNRKSAAGLMTKVAGAMVG